MRYMQVSEGFINVHSDSPILSLTHTHSCTQNKEFSSFPSNEELQHKLFKRLSSLINHLKNQFPSEAEEEEEQEEEERRGG